MTIAKWLFETMGILGEAGVDSPRRDALVLLEDTLDKDRSWVLAHPEFSIHAPSLEIVNGLVERRVNREPLAYIRGKAWFYGRFFEVNQRVMIPRPESEAFIEILKELANSGQLTEDSRMRIVDVGTGSGCLAITAALEFPASQITAIDISPQALEVARKNARNHNVAIEFLEGYLLEPLLPSTSNLTPSIIIANLPYVPKDLITSPEITQEPAEALFSGTDGLDHYQSFWGQLSTIRNHPLHILTESLESQHSDLTGLAIKSGYTLTQTSGLVQHFSKII